MTTWTDAAQALLTLAGAVEIPSSDDPEAVPLSTTVARQFVAPGPRFALDCSLLAVHAEVVRPLPGGGDTRLGMDFPCVVVPTIALVLTYAEDCVPVPDKGGNPPAPDDVTAWSVQYLERATRLWQGVLDGVLSGALDSAGCQDATAGELRMEGPSGAMAWCRIPVAVRLAS